MAGIDRLPAAGERFRCTACGNVTRFDVVETATTRRYLHADLSGSSTFEEEDVLSHIVEQVTCRWCGRADAVVLEHHPANNDG